GSLAGVVAPSKDIANAADCGRGARPPRIDTISSRSTHATLGSVRNDAITASICVVSVASKRVASMAGETRALRNGCDAASDAARLCNCNIALRATDMERYAPEPAAATPSLSLRKPTTMRFDIGRRVTVRWLPMPSDRAGERENVAPKMFVFAGVTTPLIVAPLLATNDTDAPEMLALVTVTTCVPAVGASVHVTFDLPSLSVTVDVADNEPPPTTVHVSVTPDTERPAPSST